MDNYSHRVSLKKPEKPEPWTDPETGEIYPGGKPIDPTEVYTPSQAPAPAFQQAPAFEQDVMPQQTNPPAPQQVSAPAPAQATCFCRACGHGMTAKDRFCPGCGAAQFGEQPQQVVINNYNMNNIGSNNTIVNGGMPRNKWVAVILCFFFGVLGVHRFYEHKTATGILWLCTGGMFGIGWLADLFILLFKPNPYFVKNK